MAYKVDFLYPFDKGFFGKTLADSANKAVKIDNPSNLKMDSVDDLVKHFKDECIRCAFERSPKVDSFEVKPVENVIAFPNVFSL